MKHKRISIFMAIAALLLSVRTMQAQGPAPNPVGSQTVLGTAFTYQGQLADGAGPVNARCDFQFSLWDSLAGSGGQIGPTEAKSDTNVTNGLFTVSLDFGGSAFAGEARWLEVAVRCPSGSGAYTTLSPRQPLTPAPYALYARTIPLAGSGSAVSAARSDHTHDPLYWKVGGNGGLTPGSAILGTTNTTTLTLVVNNTPALRLLPSDGTPNLIGGAESNWVTPGATGATIGGGGAGGFFNQKVTDDYGTVSGGYNNRAGDGAGTTSDKPYATVGGGDYNLAGGWAATVAGGHQNRAGADFATIGGGSFNIAAGDATIAGGRNNTADGGAATIGGGGQNTASGIYSTIGGGIDNLVNGHGATVGGGNNNTASGVSATVPGGQFNTAQGDWSFAAGYRAQANHTGTFIWADSTDSPIISGGSNQFIVRAGGGLWFGTTSSPAIPAGRFINTSTDAYLSSGGVWTNASDRAAKENFTPVNVQDILERLADIPITTWNYRAQGPAIQHLGPMAQDFYAAFGLGEDERHISTVDSDGVALAAIQGLYRRSQELEAENAALRQKLDELDTRLAVLEAAGSTAPNPAPLSPVLFLLGGLGLAWAGWRSNLPNRSKRWF